MGILQADDLAVDPTDSQGRARRRILRIQGGAHAMTHDWIAEEVPVEMTYNSVPFAVMMATPCDLEDLALGFSLTEGLVRHREQLLAVAVAQRLEGIELSMSVSADAPASALAADAARLLPGRSGCGLCGARSLEDVLLPPAPLRNARDFHANALQRALAALADHQPLNAATGSTHAAAWADADGRIVLSREDVGRHNALDKLIGAMLRQGLAPEAGMLLISSRASYEMVSKAARAGIGLIAAVSAPTALAVDVARGAGVCLVGFARARGYNVYAGAERLRA